MPKLTIQLDDDTYEQLQKDAELPLRRSVEAEATHRIKRFLDGNRNKRALILSPTQRQALDVMVGATISSPEDLIQRIKNLSCVKVGTVERPLSDGESIRLREQAMFHGQTPDVYMSRVLNEVLDRAFDRF